MNRNKNYHFETKVVHSGYDAKQHLDSLTTPIYQTSTFMFPSMEKGAKRFSGQEPGYIYSRISNPTVSVLEGRTYSATRSRGGSTSIWLWYGSSLITINWNHKSK
ncbi:PLP-dependent transferase [Halalkalibacter flavus]|uniref:PLP-dependent transferase n=1 Tax=Halalkalibacter flavus TaxID=3090668 RepID=UPI003D673127